MTSTIVVRSGWDTIAGSFLIAAAPIGRRTATILEMNIAIVRVAATKPETLNAPVAKSAVQQFPFQIDPSTIGFTMPVYCSIVNQINPKIPTKTAIINAETASFLRILKKSFGVNSLSAKPRIMRAIVCPPAFPPVSIITGINAFEHVVCTTKVVNDNAKYDSSITWSDLGVICEIESENAEEHVFSYVDDSGKPVEIGIPNAQFSRVNFYGNIIEIVIYDGYDIDSYKGDVKDINISYDGKSKVFKFPKLQDSTTEDFEPYINNMYIRVNRYGKDKGNFYEDSSMK